MSIRHFDLTLTATVHLDDKVIDRVVNNDDDWREQFYTIVSAEGVAEHVGRNLVQGLRLSQLDGWADLPDELASSTDLDVEFVVEDFRPGKDEESP